MGINELVMGVRKCVVGAVVAGIFYCCTPVYGQTQDEIDKVDYKTRTDGTAWIWNNYNHLTPASPGHEEEYERLFKEYYQKHFHKNLKAVMDKNRRTPPTPKEGLDLDDIIRMADTDTRKICEKVASSFAPKNTELYEGLYKNVYQKLFHKLKDEYTKKGKTSHKLRISMSLLMREADAAPNAIDGGGGFSGFGYDDGSGVKAYDVPTAEEVFAEILADKIIDVYSQKEPKNLATLQNEAIEEMEKRKKDIVEKRLADYKRNEADIDRRKKEIQQTKEDNKPSNEKCDPKAEHGETCPDTKNGGEGKIREATGSKGGVPEGVGSNGE